MCYILYNTYNIYISYQFIIVKDLEYNTMLCFNIQKVEKYKMKNRKKYYLERKINNKLEENIPFTFELDSMTSI